MQLLAWNAPELPVIPWTRSLVLLSTRIDMGFDGLPRMSLVDGDRIPIRVRDDHHSADRTFKRLHHNFYVVGAKGAHRGIEILHLESDGRTIA
jgi:hypothetical protein